METQVKVDQSDYIESATLLAGESWVGKTNCGTCKSTCKSCGDGCYGCKGSKSSKAANAALCESSREFVLVNMIRAELD